MKRLAIIFLVIAAAISVRAEYLFWALDAEDYESVLSGSKPTTGDTSAYAAHLMYSMDGGVSYSEATSWTTDGRVSMTTPQFDDGSIETLAVNLSTLGGITSSYRFYIEIINSSGDALAQSSAETYANLSNYIGSGSLSEVPTVGAWHGGTMSAVPEPGTVALLALGAGLIGYRKRKLLKKKKA